MSAPESAAVTPGQAALWVTFTWDYREQPPMEAIANRIAELTGGTVTMEMPETGTDEYKLVIAARQPQPAPGVTEAQLTTALEGFNVDINDHGFTAAGVVDNPAVAARGLLARLGDVKPAPELAAAMGESRKVADAANVVLDLFAKGSGGWTARISQVNLARAYRAIGRPVPDELRRFL